MLKLESAAADISLKRPLPKIYILEIHIQSDTKKKNSLNDRIFCATYTRISNAVSARVPC
jgi:hypothetical protein